MYLGLNPPTYGMRAISGCEIRLTTESNFSVAFIRKMSKTLFQWVIGLLLVLAVAMTFLGGILDISDSSEKRRIAGISKAHAWNDGIFLTVFVIALVLVWISL